MADVGERLDSIEQALTTTNKQLGEIKERLDNHDERFDQIDGRFTQIDERFKKVDERFDTMDERFDTTDARFDSMDTRIDSLASNVQKLRVLEEQNSDQIRVIAEVQSRHGEKLDELVKAIEPLRVLPDMFKQVVQDHERRIAALERRE